jgi:hypothetical protein
MSTTDYIPGGDADAIAEGRVRVNYAQANLDKLNLTIEELKPLKDALDLFEDKYDANVATQAEARSARESKDDARDDWEKLDRAFNGRMQSDLEVTDEDRAAMKLRVYDTVKTDSAAQINTFPVGVVDTSQKLRHEISWRDSGTPDSRAKPAGVFGCQILFKIGGSAPVDAKECEEAAIDRNSPYLMQFDGADGGKTCWYLLRWIMSSGEKGAISPLYSATITN